MKRKNFAIRLCIMAACCVFGLMNSHLADARSSKGIVINKKNFANEVIRNTAKKYDKNKDGRLSVSENKKIKKLTLEYGEYKDRNDKIIGGLDKLKYLEKLDIAHMDLKELDLSQNTRLKSVELCGLKCNVKFGKQKNLKKISGVNMQLKSLDVSGCTNLEELYYGCGIIGEQTRLSSIEFGKDSNIKKLGVTGQNIGNMDFSELKKLESLSITMDDTLVSFDASKLHLKELNLSTNKSLTVINLGASPASEETTLDNAQKKSLSKDKITCDEGVTILE